MQNLWPRNAAHLFTGPCYQVSIAAKVGSELTDDGQSERQHGRDIAAAEGHSQPRARLTPLRDTLDILTTKEKLTALKAAGVVRQ